LSGWRARSRSVLADREASSSSSAPTAEHAVDAFVVATPPIHHRRVREGLVVDHRQQGLRQVVVHVGVDAEKHQTQCRQVGWRVEGEPPRAGRVAARQMRVECGEVELGELDVPPLDPLRVLEQPLVDGGPDGRRRAQVGAEELP
jgi:hypothetical protein